MIHLFLWFLLQKAKPHIIEWVAKQSLDLLIFVLGMPWWILGSIGLANKKPKKKKLGNKPKSKTDIDAKPNPIPIKKQAVGIEPGLKRLAMIAAAQCVP